MPTIRTHRKRLSQKELRAPDEFQTFVDSAREFLSSNLQQVLVSAGIVLAAGALAVGIYYYEIHRDNLAGDRFYSALNALDHKNYPEAEGGFQRLADDETGRQVGKLARFYLGATYLDAGDLPKAQSALVAFLAGSHDDVFTSLALEDLGVVYERLGESKEGRGRILAGRRNCRTGTGARRTRRRARPDGVERQAGRDRGLSAISRGESLFAGSSDCDRSVGDARRSACQ